MTREEKFNDYDGFVEKFKPKRTTDDCYTPQPIYEALLGWLRENVPAVRDATEIVRPFWPGSDYQAVDYPEGCVVVDNPPFSILGKIVDYYRASSVKFWLFAPHLILFNYCSRPDVTAVVTHDRVVYENGAEVNTSFLTNCWPTDSRAVVAGSLTKAINDANKAHRTATGARKQRKINHHPNITSAALLGKVCVEGVNIDFPRGETSFIRKTDGGVGIYGTGLLVSDRLAAELRAAELRAAELRAAELRAAELRAAATVELSLREMQIIEQLNNNVL